MAALKAEAGQTVEAKKAELASARRDGEALKSRLEETEGRDGLYRNRSSRKIDSQRLFSSE